MMKDPKEITFPHSKFAVWLVSGLVSLVALISFSLGIATNFFTSKSTSFPTTEFVGAAAATVIALGTANTVVESAIQREVQERMDANVGLYQGKLEYLEKKISRLDNEEVRDECLALLTQLEGGIKQLRQEQAAIAKVVSYLQNSQKFDCLMEAAIRTVVEMHNDFKDQADINLFAHDVKGYLVILLQGLEKFPNIKVKDERELCLAIEEGSLRSLEPYKTAANAITDRLEDYSGRTDVVKRVTDWYLTYLDDLTSSGRGKIEA